MILIIRIAYRESLALRHLIRPYVPILSGDTKPSSVAITASGVSLPVAGFSSVGTPAIVNSKVVASLSSLTVCVLRSTAGSAQI